MNGGPNWRIGEDADPDAGDPEEQVAHLEQRAEALRSLLATTGGALLQLDGDGTVEAVDGGGGPLALDPARLVGKPLDTLVPPEGVAGTLLADNELVELVDGLAETAGERTIVIPLSTTGGDRRQVRLSAAGLEDGYLCTLEDAGDRTHDERELDRYRDLVNAVGDPLYVLDSEGRIEQVNDAMVAYTGYERDELVGRAIGEIIPSPEYDSATRRLQSLATGQAGDSDTFETRLVTKDGELIHSEAKVTVLTGDEGEYAGSVGVLRDIRDRKQRERDLELLKQVLTRVFRHNVRNELTIVQSNAELLERHVDADTAELTGTILATCQRLLAHSEKARFLEQIIDTDKRTEIDIAKQVVDLADSARADAPEATIDVDVSPPTRVEAHPDISKAIEELVENAIQHTPADRDPVVRIWIDETDAFRTLFVEDESGGLADHEIDVLREGDESDLEHGSGVGLWLVRWLVEHSNAEMIAHGTDEGSLMGIRFPRLDRQRDEARGRVDDDAPFTRAPAHVRELSPERFRGETVVGRMEELHRLEDVYDAVGRTGGHAVLVTGERGVGKTTLVEQFRVRLAEDDDPPLIATAHCESGMTPPYHALRLALGDLPVETELESTLAGVGPTGSDDPETVKQRKQALFAGVAETLRELAIDHPIVLVVEDLQWADPGTVDLLAYLIEEVGRWALPILFVGTFRTGDVAETDPIVEITEQTVETGRGTVLELDPFDPDDVRNLLSYMLDVEDVPDSFVTAVHDHTGGTPLFVAEIGRQLTETLGPSPESTELPETLDAVALPTSVENAVTERIDALYEPVSALLELGAVVGDTVSFDVLRDASDYTETELVEYADRLVDKHIWERTGGELAFVHGVIREKALERIGADRKRELNARVAAAVERVHAGRLEEHYGRLATHYDDAGDSQAAIGYYRRAGERAADAYAHEDAVTSYERALTLAADDDADPELLATLYGDLAEVFRTVGDLDSARETGQEGLSVAPTGTRETCRLLGIVADVQTDQSDFQQAIETTERQRDLAAELDATTLEAEAVRRLGVIAKNQGEYDRAREYYETALSLTDGDGNREFEAKVRKELGVVAWRQGEYGTAREYFEDSLAIARDVGVRPLEAACLNNLGGVALRQGEYDQALSYHERSLDIKRDIGDRKGESYSLNNIGEILTWQGEYDRAREYYEDSLAIKRDIGNLRGQTETLLNLGIAARHQSEYEQARSYHEESLEIARDIGERLREAKNLVHVGNVALQQAEYDRARDCFEESLDISQELDNPVEEIDSLRGLGTVARRQDRYDQAREFLEEALAVGDAAQHPAEIARTHLETARLALARGDRDLAREHVGTARDIFERLETRLWIGRCRVLQGRLAALGSSSATASDHWETALETFEEISALQDALWTLELLVEHCRDEGDEDRAREWCRRARQLLADAPDPVVVQHEEWVRHNAAALDLD